jgi:hypothetical protein
LALGHADDLCHSYELHATGAWQVVEAARMKDDYCVFVILASLIALALPPLASAFYLVAACVLVWLAGRAGGLESGAAVTRSGDHDTRSR